MKYYDYSRQDAINHTIKRYEEYLNMAEHDKTFDSVCSYHLIFQKVLPSELNEKIENIISNIGAKTQQIKTGPGITKQAFAISDRIKTKDLLGNILSALTGNAENILEIEACLKGFLRRFEVFGKIHDGYTGNFKKGLGDYYDIHNYALLAASLLYSEGFKNNLKVANCILKLNDLLEILIDKVKIPRIFPLLLYSFIKEREEINRLYDSKGFGMPAGQK